MWQYRVTGEFPAARTFTVTKTRTEIYSLLTHSRSSWQPKDDDSLISIRLVNTRPSKGLAGENKYLLFISEPFLNNVLACQRPESRKLSPALSGKRKKDNTCQVHTYCVPPPPPQRKNNSSARHVRYVASVGISTPQWRTVAQYHEAYACTCACAPLLHGSRQITTTDDLQCLTLRFFYDMI